MAREVVPSDIEINADIVERVVSEQFGIEVESCELLGEGWDNAVFLVNKQWVFRFPRRKEAITLLEREIMVLKALNPYLSLKTPEPVFVGKPSEIFPRPFFGHEFLAGKTGCSVALSKDEFILAARDLARFLKELHALQPKELELPLKLEPAYNRAEFQRMFGLFNDRLHQVDENYDLRQYCAKFDDICAKAQKYHPSSIDMVLVHGDLYHRHLIFDQANRLSGIIDWGDTCIGDPVADLGVVFQFFPKFTHDAFFASYGKVDALALDYARFLGLYYAVVLLWYGHDRTDQDLISTSLKTLELI